MMREQNDTTNILDGNDTCMFYNDYQGITTEDDPDRAFHVTMLILGVIGKYRILVVGFSLFSIQPWPKPPSINKIEFHFSF